VRRVVDLSRVLQIDRCAAYQSRLMTGTVVDRMQQVVYMYVFKDTRNNDLINDSKFVKNNKTTARGAQASGLTRRAGPL
jgi:hypothetical protein